jgi:hypothetical protein
MPMLVLKNAGNRDPCHENNAGRESFSVCGCASVFGEIQLGDSPFDIESSVAQRFDRKNSRSKLADASASTPPVVWA